MATLKGNNYAYVTLLSDDLYIYYVIGLYYSLLATKPLYQFKCVVTDNVKQSTRNILRQAHIPTIDIDTSDINTALDGMNNLTDSESFINAMRKFKIFTLTQFDKCVYLDADMWVSRNIDDLFTRPEWSAVEDICTIKYADKYTYFDGQTQFNSGLFVFKPSKEYFYKVLETLPTLPKLAGSDWLCSKWHDQNILCYLNRNWINNKALHLPVEYNFLMDASAPVIYADRLLDIKVRHYVGEKRKLINGPAYYVVADLYWAWMEYVTFINRLIKVLQLPLPFINHKNIVPFFGDVQ